MLCNIIRKSGVFLSLVQKIKQEKLKSNIVYIKLNINFFNRDFIKNKTHSIFLKDASKKKEFFI